MARIMLGWFSPSEDPGFKLDNGLTLHVTHSDVTNLTADVIAVEEDADWLDNGHVIQWLLRAGGRCYQNGRGQLREQVRKFGAGRGVFSCPLGGDSHPRHVIHVMTSSAGHRKDWQQHLKEMFHKVAEMADELKAETLILPLLGLEDSTTADCTDSVLTSLQAAVNVLAKMSPGCLATVTLSVADRRTHALCTQALSQVLQKTSQAGTPSQGPNIQDSPGDLAAAVEAFDLSNGVKVKLAQGDVTAMCGHALVVGENEKFNGSGGLASVLLREGGDSYKAERRKMVKSLSKEDKKEKLVFFCSAGKELMFYKILHVLVPDFKFPFGKGSRACQVLEDLYLRVFTSAQEMRLPSLHTPLLGAGKAGANFTESLTALLEALSKLSPGILREVSIVERDVSKATAIRNKLRESLPASQPTEVKAVTPDP